MSGENENTSTPLSLDEVQALPDNHRSDYLAMRRMFEGTGWKLYMQWISQQATEIQLRQLNAKSWDDFLIAKGGVGMAATVASIEQITDMTYRNVAENSRPETPEDE